MGSLIFVVEDKIQNMKLRFILLFAFLFAAVSALPGKENMKWVDTSDEMEEDEIYQMDDAVNTVDDEPQENGEEMEGTVSVEGKYGRGGYYGRRKRGAGKKGKVGIAQPYTGNENAEAEDDEPQAEGEEMEGTVSVEGKYGRWGYFGRRKRGA